MLVFKYGLNFAYPIDQVLKNFSGYMRDLKGAGKALFLGNVYCDIKFVNF
jgi:hypothetical protein